MNREATRHPVRWLGGLSLQELLRRVARGCIDDDLLGRSAQLAYYFFLAVFPFFLILVTVLGFMAQSSSTFLDTILRYVGEVAPRSAHHLVITTVHEIRSGAGAGKLSLGILGTLWAASMGVGGIINGLNCAYGIEESRPWWRTELLQIGLTLALGGFTIVALSALLYGTQFASTIAEFVGIERTWSWVWAALHGPLAAGLLLAAVMVIYKYAPDLEDQHWKHVVPGALVAVALWICASLGLRVYLSIRTAYSASYGSLGAVITLLLWFYVTAAALLIGGEVNSEIENAAAQSGVLDAHRAGEKLPGYLVAGDRPAPEAERER